MLAIQDGVISPPSRLVRGTIRLNIRQEPLALRGLLHKRVRGDRVPRFALRSQLLIEECGVLRQQRSRDLENLSRTSAVAIQHHRFENLEIVLKTNQNLWIRSGPREDRLFLVSHIKEIAVILYELFQHEILRGIQVLKLVDQDVVPLRRHREDRLVTHEHRLVFRRERGILQAVTTEGRQ